MPGARKRQLDGDLDASGLQVLSVKQPETPRTGLCPKKRRVDELSGLPAHRRPGTPSLSSKKVNKKEDRKREDNYDIEFVPTEDYRVHACYYRQFLQSPPKLSRMAPLPALDYETSYFQYTIVLDIDETIIYTEVPELCAEKDKLLEDPSLKLPTYHYMIGQGPSADRAVSILRPGLLEFLRNLRDMRFEVILFTSGGDEYANAVRNLLNGLVKEEDERAEIERLREKEGLNGVGATALAGFSVGTPLSERGSAEKDEDTDSDNDVDSSDTDSVRGDSTPKTKRRGLLSPETPPTPMRPLRMPSLADTDTTPLGSLLELPEPAIKPATPATPARSASLSQLSALTSPLSTIFHLLTGTRPSPKTPPSPSSSTNSSVSSSPSSLSVPRSAPSTPRGGQPSLSTASPSLSAPDSESQAVLPCPPPDVIQHALGRSFCYWRLGTNGRTKDLRVLNRDLARTLIVDDDCEHFVWHPDNGIPIRAWPAFDRVVQLLDAWRQVKKTSSRVFALPSPMRLTPSGLHTTMSEEEAKEREFKLLCIEKDRDDMLQKLTNFLDCKIVRPQAKDVRKVIDEKFGFRELLVKGYDPNVYAPQGGTARGPIYLPPRRQETSVASELERELPVPIDIVV